jgi:hypothetical protein
MTTDADAQLPTLIRTARDLLRDAMRPGIDLDAFLAEVLRRTRDLAPLTSAGSSCARATAFASARPTRRTGATLA